MNIRRVTGRTVIVLVAAMSLLPVADWIPGGRSAPGYREELSGWLTGSAIALGIGFVVALFSERIPVLWRPGRASDWFRRVDPASTGALAVVAALAGTLYLLTARWVFDAKPLLIDELVQVLQARMYAHGRLWEPVFFEPAARSIMHLVEHQGRTFGHFPPGGPGWLLVGEIIGAPWIAVPLAGALAVFAWGLVLRRIETSGSVRGAALLLFAAAPFAVFMSGSHMNHTTVLMWLLFGTAALVRFVERPESKALALLLGVCFGMAAVTRPADAAAWGIAAGVWLGVRFFRDAALRRTLALVVVGGLIPLAVAAWINLQTTGSPIRSGYELLWGKNVGLGFHPAPWGPDHTVARGIELVNLYLYRLNTYLYESPIPSLLPGLAALWIAPSMRPADRYLLGAAGLVVLLYFAYWFDGFFLGPRFVYTVLPVATLWTARLPSLIGGWLGSGRILRTICYAGVVATVIAVTVGVPIRERQYAGGFQSSRWDADRAASAAGVSNAVVLVRESWGAQLIARLWALDVPRPEAERIYHNVDACVLERGITRLEQTTPRVPVENAVGELQTLMADSAKLVGSRVSPDTTERELPGSHYTGTCARRIIEDRQGFTILAPLLVARRPDILYVRELEDRNTAVVRHYPDRRVFRLTHRLDEEFPRFEPLSRDSILAEPVGSGP